MIEYRRDTILFLFWRVSNFLDTNHQVEDPLEVILEHTRPLEETDHVTFSEN